MSSSGLIPYRGHQLSTLTLEQFNFSSRRSLRVTVLLDALPSGYRIFRDNLAPLLACHMQSKRLLRYTHAERAISILLLSVRLPSDPIT